MPIVEGLAEEKDIMAIDDVVVLAKQGDREAWDALIVKFAPMVRAVAQKKVFDHHRIDDIVQETFIIAMRKIHQLRNLSSFSSWLWSITSRVTFAMNHRDRTHEMSDARGILRIAHDEHQETPLHLAMQHEHRRRLWEAVNTLCNLDREVLVAFYRDEKNIETIAHECLAPIGTIKRRLFTARQRLRGRLKKNI